MVDIIIDGDSKVERLNIIDMLEVRETGIRLCLKTNISNQIDLSCLTEIIENAGSELEYKEGTEAEIGIHCDHASITIEDLKNLINAINVIATTPYDFSDIKCTFNRGNDQLILSYLSQLVMMFCTAPDKTNMDSMAAVSDLFEKMKDPIDLLQDAALKALWGCTLNSVRVIYTTCFDARDPLCDGENGDSRDSETIQKCVVLIGDYFKTVVTISPEHIKNYVGNFLKERGFLPKHDGGSLKQSGFFQNHVGNFLKGRGFFQPSNVDKQVQIFFPDREDDSDSDVEMPQASI